MEDHLCLEGLALEWWQASRIMYLASGGRSKLKGLQEVYVPRLPISTGAKRYNDHVRSR